MRVGRVITNAIAAVAFVAGCAVALYPTVSNHFAEQRQAASIEAYEETVSELDEEDLSAYWEAAEAYNAQLVGDPVQDPFEVGSGYALPDGYEDLLDLNGDGIMAYVEIPKIDVYLPIYHGTTDEVLAVGAGHIEYTSLPVGGEGTHCVIAAHRGLPSALLFTDLDQLEVGDVFYIHVLGETHAYEVDLISVVEPDDLSELTIEEGEDYVTLLTCTPYGVNTHRLLVRGHRVAYVETDGDDVTESIATDEDRRLVLVVVAIVVATVAIVATVVVRHRRDTRRRRNPARVPRP